MDGKKEILVILRRLGYSEKDIKRLLEQKNADIILTISM